MTARAIGQNLSSRVGQPVVIENRSGGGGSIGAELTAQAAPDGHTVMVTSSSFIIHSLLYSTRYDPARDFTPVTQLVQHPYVMVVPAVIPVASVREFVAWAKAPEIGRELRIVRSRQPHSSDRRALQHRDGTQDGAHPLQRDRSCFPDMFAGQVHVTFNSILTSLPHITAGRFKALGVTSLKRTARLPEVPTLDESGLARFEVTQWYGVFAPGRTPADRVAWMQKEIAAILSAPEMAGPHRQRRLAGGWQYGCRVRPVDRSRGRQVARSHPSVRDSRRMTRSISLGGR